MMRGRAILGRRTMLRRRRRTVLRWRGRRWRRTMAMTVTMMVNIPRRFHDDRFVIAVAAWVVITAAEDQGKNERCEQGEGAFHVVYSVASATTGSSRAALRAGR
jgi:hypothetical protein